MLKNYILIALRVLKKNPLFSIINILGLAIGLAASIIIYFWVFDELSYDKFHSNAQHIYRVERNMNFDETRMRVPITSPPMGPQMLDDYPAIESFVRIANDNVLVENKSNVQTSEKLFYADSSFFNVFSFEVIKGNPNDCLKSPYKLALSESYALKYFGEIPELGSVLDVNYNGGIRPYTITAIFKDFPHNSHLQMDLIGSFESLYNVRHEMMMNSWMASHLYTYILIDENVNNKELEDRLQEMVDKYFGPGFRQFFDIDNPREALKIELKPLLDIHLNSERVWELESPGSKTSVLVFSLVSILLIVIAGINFTNLSTARASRRAMEVGVRKASGASKFQLVRQFLGESMLFSLIALVCAILIVELTLPYFSAFTGKSITIAYILKGWNLPLILAAWFITAMFAGMYPAFFLSSYKPVDVLKGKKSANGSQFFRKALVVGQFAISIGLIICAVSVFRQLHYINSKDVGYNRFGLINIPIENRENFNSYNAFREDLLKIPEVKNVTRSMVIPTSSGYTDNPHAILGNPENFFPIVNRTDENFLSTFEIELLAGNDFTPEMIADSSTYYIINDAARRMFGFDSSFDALGQFVGLLAGEQGELKYLGEIIGVCNDFHFQPLTEKIKPMVISSWHVSHNNITIKVDEQNMAKANSSIGEVWSKHFPNQLFVSDFVSQRFNNMHLTERRLQVILLIFTFLSIFVACLGLFGLSAFSVEQRTKEIGVRKTLGAEMYQILVLIVSEFSQLVIISCLIAMPIAYFILREWLNNFPYRQDIEVWVFVAAALIGWLTAILTVLFQTYKAARINPVETLKYE